MIVCVVSDVDQLFPEISEETKSTEPPAQNEVAPLGVIIGDVGFAFTVITVGAEVIEQPFPSV